jgi:UDP-glucose 4-epimerase
MTKILVLGSGYLGSEIISQFSHDNEVTVVDHGKNFNIILQKCHNVNFIQSDILDFESYRNHIENSVIFYCVDNGGVVESIKNPQKYEKINIANFSKLITFLNDFTCKFYLFSTSYVYSGDTIASELDSLEPTTLYGELRKTQEEFLVKSKINYTILRLSNVYGYGTFQKIGNLGAIEKFMINALSGKSILLYGKGDQKIDYLHISDLMILLHKLIKINKKNLIFNVCTEKALELSEIANLIKKIIGNQYDVTVEKVPSMDIPNSPSMSIKKIKDTLNWIPKIDIKSGISLLLKTLKN